MYSSCPDVQAHRESRHSLSTVPGDRHYHKAGVVSECVDRGVSGHLVQPYVRKPRMGRVWTRAFICFFGSHPQMGVKLHAPALVELNRNYLLIARYIEQDDVWILDPLH